MGHGEMKFPFRKVDAEQQADDQESELDLEEFELDLDELMAAVSQRVSRFVLDAKFGHEKETVDALGLEISDTAFVEEIEMSEERVARLRGLSLLFHNFAALASHSMVSALEAAVDDFDDDEAIEVFGNLHALLEYLVFTTTRAVVAQLEDMGLITYNWETKA
jgi:hypothetical protein